MWWAYVTITSIGYGDRFPVTSMGRIVGIMVMTTGVAVFATFAENIKQTPNSGQKRGRISGTDSGLAKIGNKGITELMMSDPEIIIDKRSPAVSKVLEPLLEKRSSSGP